MNEQEFTVFAENNEWQDSQPDVGRTVEEICKWFHGVGCWPVAWCEGSAYGRVKELREESLEAGRLIEKTASGWVALGAEKQANTFVTVEQDLRDIQQILGVVPREDDLTPADVDMIDRDQRPHAQPEPVRFDPFKGFFAD